MNIHHEFLALLSSLNCEYQIQDGIVIVTTPEGKTWDYTVPMEATE